MKPIGASASRNNQSFADEEVANSVCAGTTFWPFADQLGTLNDLAEYEPSIEQANIVNHDVYDAYGNLLSQTNADADELFGYTGKALDESTELQNNFNRWQDTKTGDWISEEPIGFAADDVNISRYVGNSD